MLSAIESGNPTAIEKAWRKGIAAGVLKQERPTQDSYRPITDPMTGELKGSFNERTGEMKATAPVTTKEDVARALATGKISKEEVARRIAAAGGNPKDFGL